MESVENYDDDGGFVDATDCEEEFRSCCGDGELEDSEECLCEFSCIGDIEDSDESLSEFSCIRDSDSDDDEEDSDDEDFSLRMTFKGVSYSEKNGGLGAKASGIGVVMDASVGLGDTVFQIQKKLDFFVDDLVAEHLALLDGLIDAQSKGFQRIVAFTDNQEVYHQIAEAEPHADQLLVALGYRILELANNLESFALKLVPSPQLEMPRKLAREAVGIIDKSQKCPFPDCSVILSLGRYSSSRENLSNYSDDNCVECHECQRLVCAGCVVPWHSSMSCEEYRGLSEDERCALDFKLANNNNWRRCRQCTRMIELTQGCYHVTCWCGHQFCYSCGAEYHGDAQTCHCVFWDGDNDEGYNSDPVATPSDEETDRWRWEPFDPLPAITDGYSEQERSQLALIQRFLAGGFGIGDDHNHHQEQQQQQQLGQCSDSYLDAIKDLNQLPWLERFVSVISDSYHEDYIQ